MSQFSLATGVLSPAEATRLYRNLDRLQSVHALTPTRIAELLGEAENLVERVVAGGVNPSREFAARVERLMLAMAYNSLEAWKQRISASHGYEVLIDRTLTIVAVNGANAALTRGKPQGPIGPQLFLGRNFNHILPSLDCTLIETPGNGIEDLLTNGFFEGKIRCVRFCAEINAGPLVRTGVHEFWPIETEDAGIVAHSILHRRDMPRVLTAPGIHVHWREVVPEQPR